MQTASGMDLYFEVTITVNSSVVCGKKHKRWDKVSSPYNLYSHEADYRTVSVEVWASPVDTVWAQNTPTCQYSTSSLRLFLFSFAFPCFLSFPSRKKWNEVLLAESCQVNDYRYLKYSWLLTCQIARAPAQVAFPESPGAVCWEGRCTIQHLGMSCALAEQATKRVISPLEICLWQCCWNFVRFVCFGILNRHFLLMYLLEVMEVHYCKDKNGFRDY